MARKLKSDKLLFIATLLLVCVSVVMVYSASAVMAMEPVSSPYCFCSSRRLGAAGLAADARRDARSTTATTGSRRSSGRCWRRRSLRARRRAVRPAASTAPRAGSARRHRRPAVGARQAGGDPLHGRAPRAADGAHRRVGYSLLPIGDRRSARWSRLILLEPDLGTAVSICIDRGDDGVCRRPELLLRHRPAAWSRCPRCTCW